MRGERAGYLPEPKFSDRPWTTGNSLHYVIGQELTVTPLQMCAVSATVANNGMLPKPNLVRRIRWPGYMHRKQMVRKRGEFKKVKLESEDTLSVVRQGMRAAVSMEHGTAGTFDELIEPEEGAVRQTPLTVAAKTGTAQHNPKKPNHSWCIAFAPYSPATGEPQYAIAVFVAQGGTGSATAVPIAKIIIRALFGAYQPDDPV